MAGELPFGRLVRERRRALDLTQEELAARVGCAAITVRKIESGQLRPSHQVVDRLATVLGVPLDERQAFTRAGRAVRVEPRESPSPRRETTPTSDRPDGAPPGGQLLRGYLLGEQIGKGGFGAVYRAIQAVVEREVAIKIILPHYADQPEFIRRFEAEAQLVARLEHPHIVPLYDYWREPGVAYLVMRMLRGGSLHAWLKESAPPLPVTRRLIEQIGGALQAAHAAGVVHRDLKPANILLDDERNAYLADFGIARDLAQPQEAVALAGAFVGSPAYSSPEQIRAEPVTPQTDIYALGVLLYELLTGQRPFDGPTPAAYIQQHLTASIPHLAARRSGLPSALDKVIQRATAKVPGARYASALELVADVQAILAERTLAVADGRPPAAIAPPTLILGLPEGDNPYRGLRPFDEADAAHFFGREALIQRLLTRMGEGGELARFLAVIGPSGSGKSSVVRAGLIPTLRSGGLPGSEQWYIVDLLPGSDPLGELAAALRRVAPAGVGFDELRALLQDDARGLLQASHLVLPATPETELVLVIDQFEELFTLCDDETTRTHVLDSLVIAALDERSRVRLVITLRADFVDRPLQYVDFGELLTRRGELVAPLTPDELERAVASPARHAGLALEEGLVAAIVADVGDQPGALPLLQHALSELYTRRSGRAMTRASYAQIGGVTGALAQSAEACYQALGPEGQAVARRVLLTMVSPGDGAEDTRRRLRRADLEHAGPPAALAGVLEQFGAARLLTFDRDPLSREPTVEVAHEALLRAWPRLGDWIDAARADLRLHQQLARATDEWRASGSDPSFLASGARLEQLGGLAVSADLVLREDERAYLSASQTEAERAAQAEVTRRANELEQARQLAEEQRRRAEAAQKVVTAQRSAAGRLRALVIGLALFLAVAIGLSVFAFGQRQQAQTSAAAAQASFVHAEAQRLAAEANVVAQAGGSSELVALLALRSLQLEYTPQGDAALAAAATQELPLRTLRGHEHWLEDVAFSPDGRSLASASRDGTVRLWDAASGQEQGQLIGHDGPVFAVAFAPDGLTIASGGYDHTVRLWDVQTRQEVRRFGGGGGATEGAVYAVVFSPDGTTIASGGADARIHLWDSDSGKHLRTVASGVSTVYGLAYSPDGRRLASAHSDTFVRVWDVENPRAYQVLSGHQDQVRNVVFSPDGKTLLSGSFDRTARLWDLATGEELRQLGNHREFVWDVEFTPDGQRAITISQDKSARLWDLATGSEIRRYTGHQNYIVAAALSPDGAYLATASRDNTAMLWRIEPDRDVVQLLGHNEDVHMAVYSPDGRYVLTGSLDHTARLWEVASGREVQLFRGHGAAIHAVAFAPDRRHVATAGFDGLIIIWDIETGKLVERLGGHRGTVYGLAYSPDGRWLVTSGDDGLPIIIIWDTTTWAPIRELEGHTGAIHTLAVSPDSRQLLSGSFDRTVRLWDLERGEELRRFAMDDGVETLSFAPDGRSFVSGGFDKVARIWDLATGTEVRQLVGHSDVVKGAVFTPDGRSVVTGSADGTARLWDVASGQELRRFSGHAGIVNSVAVSADSKFICTASGDRTARLWTLDYRQTVAETCGRLGRDLTPAERMQFGITDNGPTCPAR